MKTSWFKTMTAAAVAALTFGFAPKAQAAETVEYREPVYKTAGDPKSGIDHWETKSVSTYTVVASDQTAWNAGCYVVKGNVEMSSGVTVSGDVKLILTDGCLMTVQGTGAAAGICVSGSGNALTIYGQSAGTGTLRASALGGSGQSGAGIGGNSSSEGSNITINGGTVTANAGFRSAGIGGGRGCGGSNITINGGTVTAKGDGEAAGIGGGLSGTGSNITINGGTVTATGGIAGGCAGIGGGREGNGEYITINDGMVTATGGIQAAGIGGGSRGAGSNITINGGTVTATAGDSSSQNGAGIGGGYQGAASYITISGGTVTATGGKYGAGIGGGFTGEGSNITISGGMVTATGGLYGAGIGGGCSGAGSNITISGGTVTAGGVAGSYGSGAGIGGGLGGKGSDIEIGQNAAVYVHGDAELIGSGAVGDAGSGNSIAAGAKVFFNLAGTDMPTSFEGFTIMVPETPEESVLVGGIANWPNGTSFNLTNAVSGATGTITVNGNPVEFANKILKLLYDATAQTLTLTAEDPPPLVVVTPTDVAHTVQPAKVYTNGVEVALSGTPPSCSVLSNQTDTIIVYTAEAGFEFPGGATAYTNHMDTAKNPAEIAGGEQPPSEPKLALVMVVPAQVEHATAKVYTNDVEVAGPPFAVVSNATVKVVYTAEDGYAFADGSRTFDTGEFTADKNPTTVPEGKLPQEPEAITLTGVMARQRYPWNGLVDIDYTLSGELPDVYTLKAYAVNGTVTNEAKTVTFEATALKKGTHRLTWDMDADAKGSFEGLVSADVVFTVVAEFAHEAVQLWAGGPYFATCNVGATQPTDSGYYFWWGDTVGYRRNATDDGWISVKDGTTITFDTGHCPTYNKDADTLKTLGYIDDATNPYLNAAHDAATAHWGSPWRMPTYEELRMLVNDSSGEARCEWTAVSKGETLIGLKVSGKNEFANNSIFIPAAGIGDGSARSYFGFGGSCWGSLPITAGRSVAVQLMSSLQQISAELRCTGIPVRPVRGGAAVSISAESSATKLDLRTGEVREAAVGATETLTYTTNYVGGAAADATVGITVNGEELASGLTGEGSVEWVPVDPGTYELAHIVCVGGTTVTNLVAKFLVPPPPPVYTNPEQYKVANTTYQIYTNGVPVSEVVPGLGVFQITSNDMATVVYTCDTGYEFLDGSTVKTNTLDTVHNPVVPSGETPTAPVLVTEPTLALGAMMQRYPWNNVIDIPYEMGSLMASHRYGLTVKLINGTVTNVVPTGVSVTGKTSYKGVYALDIATSAPDFLDLPRTEIRIVGEVQVK